MTQFPHEAQIALVSFLAALSIGGPIALFGTSGVVSAARLAGALALRHRLSATLGLGLLGGGGLFASWPF